MEGAAVDLLFADQAVAQVEEQGSEDFLVALLVTESQVAGQLRRPGQHVVVGDVLARQASGAFAKAPRRPGTSRRFVVISSKTSRKPKASGEGDYAEAPVFRAG